MIPALFTRMRSGWPKANGRFEHLGFWRKLAAYATWPIQRQNE